MTLFKRQSLPMILSLSLVASCAPLVTSNAVATRRQEAQHRGHHGR
jgi:hypothetical protein